MHMSYVENKSCSCFDCHLLIREGRWSFKVRTNWHVFVLGRIMQHMDIYKWIIKYSYMYYLILTELLKNIWLSKSKLTNLVRINSHPVRTNINPCVVSILMSMFRSLSCLRAFILFLQTHLVYNAFPCCICNTKCLCSSQKCCLWVRSRLTYWFA